MTFKAVIRGVFILAYGAFLYASIHHVAFFFHSFEQDNNWVGSYALAGAIDVTSLVLAIGVMFFRKGMSGWALAGVWFFILALTGFSWLVNWEYAIQFQSNGLNRAIDFTWINPVLASAFALLNIAYSVVAELFNSKPKTAQELAQENDEMTAILEQKSRRNSLRFQQLSGVISGTKSVISDAISRQNESKSEENVPQIPEEITPEIEQKVADNSLQKVKEIRAEFQDIIDEDRRKYLMTFEEASAYTGYSISYLKAQVRRREIEITDSGKLRVKTLKIRTGNTAKMPSLKVVNE